MRPAVRVLAWLVITAALVLAITAVHGVRPGLLEDLSEPHFAVNRFAALGTFIAGAIAAVELSLPGRSRLWIWLPVPFAAAWLSMMGFGCLEDWFVRGDRRLAVGRSYECFEAIVFTSLPLGAVLFWLTRHAALIRPIATAIAAGLAVAAASEAGLTLYHDVEATMMDTLIHLVGVAVVIALSLPGSKALPRDPRRLRAEAG